jgi:transposase-like protein
MDGLHHNCTTESDTFRRVEVITGVARRRRWPASEKARIVAESYAPGTSATAVALRYGLHRNQIFGWRRQFRDGAAAAANEGTGFVPVAITSCGKGQRTKATPDRRQASLFLPVAGGRKRKEQPGEELSTAGTRPRRKA